MTDVYQVPEAEAEVPQVERPENLYQVYDGSRIAVSSQMGPYWRTRYDAAMKAYEYIHAAWDTAFRYYNNSQDKSLETPRGIFKRGDATENVVYSNVNIMLPATYMKDPDFACSTTDKEDEAFCKTLQLLLNTLFRRRDKLNAKHKIRRAIGFALLTNQGVLKLDWTMKDESREWAAQEMARITQEMGKAKKQEEMEELYGQLHALETNMELFELSGPGLTTKLPHKIIIDPYAESPDGSDALWMIEETFIKTASLNAKYTKKKGDERVLLYKPTHKAIFAEGQGTRDDGLGLVMQEMDKTVTVTGHTTDEKEAAIRSEYTQCYLVWDKVTRRVMLFHRDDWKWPIWVWDDPFKLSRFFPYFLIGFGFSTGGTTSVGETAYYLDQQDEVNDINRQVAKIRRTVFDFWFYNSEHINKDEAAKFVKAIRGETQGGDRIIGVKMPEGKKVSESFEPLLPPSIQHTEQLFKKEPVLQAIDRITNTNDAIRGAQFKTNTTEDAAQMYHEAARMAIGAKTDIIEDSVADLGYALAELCVQHLSTQDVEDLVGVEAAKGWREMSLEEFRSSYSLILVAGSMEKPTSVFKKKEAVQVAQAIGQFAQAAPGATLRIMLKVLEKAFTEVVILPEDWAMLDQEMQAQMQKGISTGGEVPGGAAAPAAPGGMPPEGAPPEGGGGLAEAAMGLPPEMKQQIAQAVQGGAGQGQVIQMVQQALKG